MDKHSEKKGKKVQLTVVSEEITPNLLPAVNFVFTEILTRGEKRSCVVATDHSGRTLQLGDILLINFTTNLTH